MSEETPLFLHHYEASPYAEKIRAMLGLAGSHWCSVLSPPYPPRPNLQPLVGDFRRIPVAHIGADVFCDTALIASEVASLTGHPELAPTISDPAALALAKRAEGNVFFCAITAAPPLPLLGRLILRNGVGGTLKFVKDRTAMMKDSSMQVPQGKAAAKELQDFLGDLDAHLADRSVIEGTQPGYADFCVFHPLWLALSVGGLKTLRPFSNVDRWYSTVDKLGHGKVEDMTGEQAFDAISSAQPRPLPIDGEAHDALGDQATIAPADYGKAGVSGTLAAVSQDRYVIARDTDRCGTVHLHFPREGYALSV